MTGVIAGFGLSGLAVFYPLDADGRDAVIWEGDAFDNCLSHTTGTGMLHHHIWSPCFRKNKGLWSNTTVPANCKSTSTCTGQDALFALSAGYTNGSDKVPLEVIGLAKDGHIMYGPWDANGN